MQVLSQDVVHIMINANLIANVISKPSRRRQRHRHQTKGLMTNTMARHVLKSFLCPLRCGPMQCNFMKWLSSKRQHCANPILANLDEIKNNRCCHL